MEIQIKYTNKELEDIIQALKLGSIHGGAPAESNRMHILSQKIQAILELNNAVKK